MKNYILPDSNVVNNFSLNSHRVIDKDAGRGYIN